MIVSNLFQENVNVDLPYKINWPQEIPEVLKYPTLMGVVPTITKHMWCRNTVWKISGNQVLSYHLPFKAMLTLHTTYYEGAVWWSSTEC